MRQAMQWNDTQRWRLAAAWLLVALLSMAGGAAADEGVEVRSATTRLHGGVWYLDADINYALNEHALAALDSGLVLDIELMIRLTQRRRIIWDPTFAALTQRYQLQFHALTERYIVRNLNSGEQATYGSLGATLAALGAVRALPIIDDALLNPNDRYTVAIRAIIDIKEFGGPLALIRILWNDWRMVGDWVTWRLGR